MQDECWKIRSDWFPLPTSHCWQLQENNIESQNQANFSGRDWVLFLFWSFWSFKNRLRDINNANKGLTVVKRLSWLFSFVLYLKLLLLLWCCSCFRHIDRWMDQQEGWTLPFRRLFCHLTSWLSFPYCYRSFRWYCETAMRDIRLCLLPQWEMQTDRNRWFSLPTDLLTNPRPHFHFPRIIGFSRIDYPTIHRFFSPPTTRRPLPPFKFYFFNFFFNFKNWVSGARGGGHFSDGRWEKQRLVFLSTKCRQRERVGEAGQKGEKAKHDIDIWNLHGFFT